MGGTTIQVTFGLVKGSPVFLYSSRNPTIRGSQTITWHLNSPSGAYLNWAGPGINFKPTVDTPATWTNQQPKLNAKNNYTVQDNMNPKPPGSAVVTYNYYVSIQVGSVQTGAKGPPIWKFRDDPDITNSPPPPDGVASKRG